MVDQDMYGSPVSVLYNGKDKYQTKLGSLCTLATLGLVIAFIVAELQAAYALERQKETTQQIQFDAFTTGKFSLADSHLRIFVGSLAPIPENIGRVILYQSFFSTDDQNIKEVETEVPLIPCSEEHR